jgi:uncharacterized hydrophobic protein (TIGR00341 family)
MSLRLLEIILPETDSNHVRELIKEESVIGFWQEEESESGLLVKMLLDASQTERILDLLEEQYAAVEGFRVVLLPVEATIPRLEEPETEQKEPQQSQAEAEEDAVQIGRISREELYSDVVDSTRLTQTYLAMVTLSAIVAAVGLLRNNVAVIIGAMVIAPLLGPNVGLALATTLGDFDLGRNALKVNLAGIGLALGISMLIGFGFTVDPTFSEISIRTVVGLPDIALALASGSAGVLAFTSGVGTALIGVMVAVALLPPLVAVGLLAGAGHIAEASGALLLLLTNIICVNLAGVTTFLAQGIRPRQWWEANKAERATRWALVLWSALLIILIIIIVLAQRNPLLTGSG